MQPGITVSLTGAHVDETARALAVRLIEMGRQAERIDAAALKQLGTLKAAAYACTLLLRNGVIVIANQPKLRPEGPRLDVEVDPHDTSDFAAEKICDELAALGVVMLEAVDYSPEEEEQIRQRLANLGYIE